MIKKILIGIGVLLIAVLVGAGWYFSGLIYECPFTSRVELAQNYYPIIPVKLILKDRYESKKKLNDIKSPVLVMHGRKDNIVPFYMGQQIYEALSVPKFAYFNDQDDHMMEYNKLSLIHISEPTRPY